MGTGSEASDLSRLLELEQRLSLYRATLEASQDGLLVTDLQGRELLHNRRLLALFDLENVAPFDVDGIANDLHDAERATARLRESELHPERPGEGLLRFKDGRIYHWQAHPRLQDGQVVGKVTRFRDVTACRQAFDLLALQRRVMTDLAALSDEEEALQMLLPRLLSLDAIDLGCAFRATDEDRLCLVAAEGVPCQIATELSLLSSDNSLLRRLADGQVLCESAEDVLPEVGSLGCQACVLVPVVSDGEGLALLVLGSKTHSELPEDICRGLKTMTTALGQALARMAAERRRRESAAGLQTILDSMDDYVCIADAQGNLVLTNRALRERLGYSPEELDGVPAMELHVEDQQDVLARQIDRALSGEPELIRVPFRTKDGEPVPVECRMAPIRWGQEEGLLNVARDVGDRLDILGQLRASESRFRQLVENAQEIVFTLDMDGRVIYVSPAVESLLGLSPEDSIGSHIDDLLSDENLELVRQSLDQVLKEGSVVVEVPFGTVSGETRHLRVSATLIEKLGQPFGISGVATDITERVEAERALEQQRAFLQQVLDMSPATIFVKDAEARFVLASREERQRYGLTEEEIIGKTDLEIAETYGMSLEEARFFMETDWRILSGEEDELQYERQARSADGQMRWYRVQKRAFYTPEGARHLLGIALDVTEQHSILTALRESETRYRALVEQAPLGVFLVNRDGTLTYANRSMGEFVGIDDPDVLVGLNVLENELVRDSDLGSILMRSLESGERYSGEKMLELPDGREVYIRHYVVPIRDASGRVTSVQVLVDDISEIRDMEEKLRQSAKMEAIGRLAGGVAHNFNNLLTVINGYTELIMNGLAGDDPLKGDLSIVYDAGQRASELTEQLLAFSRRQSVQLDVFDLNVVLEGMRDMLGSLIGEDIILEMDLEDEVSCPVKADRGQIEQMLFNLAANARDAMPRGGRLRVDTQNVVLKEEQPSDYLPTPPGRYVRLTVKDTGRGISEEVKQHLFEPFYTTKGLEEGTGLGLSMVYGIVDELSGGLDVGSELGRGSVFIIDLPMASEPVPDTKPGDRGELPRGDETILVVEDDENVLHYVEQALMRLGYEVMSCRMRQEALDLWRSQGQQVDLLLTDVVMPEQSGPELVRELNRIHPCQRVLFMSGFADDALVGRGTLSPDMQLVAKPFTLKTLAQRVREVLDKDEDVAKRGRESV